MTLTTRLLVFYLGSLVLVLAGFSAVLYFVARAHLYRQADERLEAALNTLAAAVEVRSDGVEWEANERVLRIAPGPDAVAWIVADGTGTVVARSDRPASDDLLAEAAGRFNDPSDSTRRLHWRGERWQVGQRWCYPDEASPGRGDSRPADPGEVKYPVVAITAALPLEPTRAVLHNLLVALTAIALAVLAAALVAGRFVCRRALRPVRRMADDARAVDPSDVARRIVTPAGGDELTELALAFNGLLDRLHESAERQRRFAGDASHQLRTPLAALQGQIEVALRRDRPAHEYRDVLTTAHAKANQLQRIVEALLFLTRAGAEAAAPKRERLDLAAWAHSYLDQWTGHPRRGDMHLVGADEPLPVLSHTVLLGEVVNVLVDNACRYSTLGTPITVSLSRDDAAARLEVADRGQGIAPGDLPQVFTPFFRTTDALRAHKQGVGLGLPIAGRLVDALGGTLTATSRVGAGSCFVVTVPAG